MLANARSFGYAFNPLSVFWCYDRRGDARRQSSPRCTTPTASGTATSCVPTRTVDAASRQGVLRVAVLRGRRPLRDDVHRPAATGELRVAITLCARDHELSSGPPWRGSGDRRPRRRSSPGSLRHPLAGLRVMALIRLQGIAAVVAPTPRAFPVPPAPVQEGVVQARDDAKHSAFDDREPWPSGPWQDLAPAPGHQPVHTAIARSALPPRACRACVLRVAPARRSHHRRRGSRRPADACAQRRVLPAARRPTG